MQILVKIVFRPSGGGAVSQLFLSGSVDSGENCLGICDLYSSGNGFYSFVGIHKCADCASDG